ncbi:MAG: phosphoribosyltransferase [Saprospiraceae bacterium]|nr:phosphoribosyltransferase [Saprospiraceae bacterium]
MQILNNYQINQKIARLSIEILENNLDEKEIILAGINNKGFGFAQLIYNTLSKRTDKNIILGRLKLNPAHPLDHPVTLDIAEDVLKNKCVIIIDDVANTGRTIFYAFKVLMDVLPKKVEVAVLVDRKHKSFPIKVDYVGLSLATTIQEHIDARLSEAEAMEVLLN